MKRLIPIFTVIAAILAGCGSSAPTDVSLLRQACRTPPSGSAYDYAYATVSRGAVTGVAQCGSDGTVQGWSPRPSGRGDSVVIYAPGQVGP